MDGFDRYGTAGGTLVIALHGAAANRKAWLPLARALGPEFELWAIDLPGHGARRGEPFRIGTSLDVLADVLEGARPRRPIVAGDSLGGYLALAAGARFGDRPAAIVAGGCTWTMTGAAGALARASDLPPALLERMAGSERIERWFAAAARRISGPQDGPPLVDAGLSPEARSASLRELRGFDVPAHVRRLRVPLVFVNGRYDWPTRAGERAYARLAPQGGEIVVAPRCGHGVSLFAPGVFAAAIERARELATAPRRVSL